MSKRDTLSIEQAEALLDSYNYLMNFYDYEFSSGSTVGPDFKDFSTRFEKFVKKALALPDNMELVKFNKGHYILSGFIQRDNNFVYFSIPDVRHFPNEWADNILIRTAQSTQDFTGGMNIYTSIGAFIHDVDRIFEHNHQTI